MDNRIECSAQELKSKQEGSRDGLSQCLGIVQCRSVGGQSEWEERSGRWPRSCSKL